MDDKIYQLVFIWGSISVIAPWIANFAILALLAWSAGLLGGSGNRGPLPTPEPLPLPPPVPPPVTPRNTGIKSTDWAGNNDSRSSKTSAYDGHIIDGETELAAALPFHFDSPLPTIRVFANGKSVDTPIEDVGPWFDGRQGWAVDPYWQTSSRPRAETDSRTNGSGIDLTPAVYKALGFTGDLDNISSKVDWDFVSYLDAPQTGNPPPPVTTGDPPWLAHARSFIGKTWSSGDPPSWMLDLINGIMTNAANKDVDGFQAYCQQLKSGYRPWCGIFGAGCLAAAGKAVPFVKGNDLLSFAWAPSFDTWGVAVAGTPQPGDVMRFGWDSGGEHVTFYEGYYPNDDFYHILGGNQGNAVNIKTEPMDDELKFVRRPSA